MAEEKTSVETPNTPPEDFNEYVEWREKGEDSGATVETPKAESAEEAETAEEKQEPVAEEKSEPTDSEAAKGDEEDAEKAETEKPKTKGGFQRRIDRLTRERRELEESNKRLEERVAKLESGKPEEKANTESKPKPKSSDFDDFDEFTEAMTKWTIDQRESEREAKATADAEAKAKADRDDATQRMVDEHHAREAKARENYEDYDDVLESAQDVGIPQQLGMAILQHPQSAELAYHLGKNLAELERITKLPPPQALMEIGKIAAKLEPAKPQPPKKVTKAPKPITPVTGSSGPTEQSVYDPNLADDYNAWVKKREADLKRK